MWLLLLACTDAPPADSAAEADADTDADADSDTDSDADTDVVMEDCDNGLDDDGDGYADCDDDECSGEPACLGQWRMDVNVDLTRFTVDRGGPSLEAQGAIVVFGTPYGEGDAFTCTGSLSAADGFGTALGSTACDGCDLQFDVAWAPFWSDDCPITPPLPTTQLGFTYGSAWVTRSFEGDWRGQYDAASTDQIGQVWTLEDLEQQEAWSFLGYY